MDKRRLKYEEFRLIEWHNHTLIEAAEKAIPNLQAIPRRSRPAYIQRQLEYWRFVKASLEWSTAIARQRLAQGEQYVAGDVGEIVRLVERTSRDIDGCTTG